MTLTLYPASRRGDRWLPVIPIGVHLVGHEPATINCLLDSGASRHAIPDTAMERLFGLAWDDLEPAGTTRGLGGETEIRTAPGALVCQGTTFAMPVRVFRSARLPAHVGGDFLATFDVALRLRLPEPVFLVGLPGEEHGDLRLILAEPEARRRSLSARTVPSGALPAGGPLDDVATL